MPQRSRRRGRAAAGGRQGRRLLVDRRRADHGQGARPTTAPPSSTSRATTRPTACASSARSRTTSRASTAASSSAAFNTSKLSLQLNLKHPTGVDIARRLLAWCDIALDSFTAGTMADLGLGYDVARELNPGIIMATTCLLGQYGPAAKLAGYGYHAAAVSGFYEITGWDDRPPAGPFNAYTDTVAPRFLTTTLLAALDHRRRTGRGPVHRPGADGVGAALPRPRAARRPGVGHQRPARRQPSTRTTRRTTPSRAPATTSGARSPSRPTSSGAALRGVLGDPAWAHGPGARHRGRPARRRPS